MSSWRSALSPSQQEAIQQEKLARIELRAEYRRFRKERGLDNPEAARALALAERDAVRHGRVPTMLAFPRSEQ